MYVIVRSPNLLFDSNPMKIFFWNRSSPFAAIVKLTKTKLMNNFICFAKQSLIASFIIVNGSWLGRDSGKSRPSFCDCRRMTFFNAACRDGFRYRSVFPQSSILPSVEMVTTCHGINFPLCCNAVFAACSSPPQQGTSMRTMVTL